MVLRWRRTRARPQDPRPSSVHLSHRPKCIFLASISSLPRTRNPSSLQSLQGHLLATRRQGRALLRSQMMVKRFNLLMMLFVCTTRLVHPLLHRLAISTHLPMLLTLWAAWGSMCLFFVVFNVAVSLISQVTMGIPIPPAAPAAAAPSGHAAACVAAGLPVPPLPPSKEAPKFVLVQVGFVFCLANKPITSHCQAKDDLASINTPPAVVASHRLSCGFQLKPFMLLRCQRVRHGSNPHLNMVDMVERDPFGPDCFNVSYFVLDVTLDVHDEPMFSIRLDASMGTSSWKPIPQNMCFEFLVIECL